MNGFIVWDEIKQIFIDNAGIAPKNSEDYMDEFGTWFVSLNSNRFKVFTNIGMEDINGKSIYADSSIIECEYKALRKKVKGYFKYSDITLGYHLHLLERSTGRAFRFDYEYMYDFKIIDTVQENKLGLIK